MAANGSNEVMLHLLQAFAAVERAGNALGFGWGEELDLIARS